MQKDVAERISVVKKSQESFRADATTEADGERHCFWTGVGQYCLVSWHHGDNSVSSGS